jgi:hypothetical protein
MNGFLDVPLVLRRYFPGINILPLELIAHAATGKNRHGQFSATEATIFHRSER